VTNVELIDTFHLKCKVNRRVAEIDKSILKKKKKRKKIPSLKVKGFSCKFVKLLLSTRGMNQIWLEVRHEK